MRAASKWKADRVKSATTTIFAEMSALAVATQSVNLGQGFPDYDGPDFMLAAAEQAIADGVNQYPPARGIAPLRQAIVAHSARHYGLAYDPDTEVVVTTGATEALAAAILAFVEPGDEVIALEPFYDSYAASIDLAGGTRVGVGLFGPDFRLDLAELEQAITPRTKLLVDQLPAQPDRHRAGRRATGPDRRTGRPARSAGRLRRGVRAPGLRRRGAPPARHLPRHARADHPHLLVGQDVLGDRLEDRLGAGAGAVDHRADRGQAVLDLRLGGAVPARGGASAGRGRRLDRRRPPRAPGQA